VVVPVTDYGVLPAGTPLGKDDDGTAATNRREAMKPSKATTVAAVWTWLPAAVIVLYAPRPGQ